MLIFLLPSIFRTLSCLLSGITMKTRDGSGYPDGLSGTEIPIGARILAVVDCFDALTSDRPYRSRLTIDEALEILTARRGSMYDPLVVDVFVQLQSQWSRADTGDKFTAPVESFVEFLWRFLSGRASTDLAWGTPRQQLHAECL